MLAEAFHGDRGNRLFTQTLVPWADPADDLIDGYQAPTAPSGTITGGCRRSSSPTSRDGPLFRTVGKDNKARERGIGGWGTVGRWHVTSPNGVAEQILYEYHGS